MSLDVYLVNADDCEVYWANITHNLGRMAQQADIYEALWCPDKYGFKAQNLIEPIAAGLQKLVERPSYFVQFESPNGWGKWEHFLPWVARYLEACRHNPECSVRVSR